MAEVNVAEGSAVAHVPQKFVRDGTTLNTLTAVQQIVEQDVPGDFIECGVYQGRQVVFMLAMLQQLGVTDREIYLYDTFAGMSQPGPHDGIMNRANAQGVMRRWDNLRNVDGSNGWAKCRLDEVRENILATGYPQDRVHFVQGSVLETVKTKNHQQIALLRLDTDWYHTIKHDLAELWPQVSPGGVVIVDDYGKFVGAKKAVDEFIMNAPLGTAMRTFESGDCWIAKP